MFASKRRNLVLLLCLILVALAVLLPQIASALARWGLSEFLQGAGATSVGMAEVSIDPYRGTASVKDLQYEADGREYRVASAQLSWIPSQLWQRQLHITSLSIRGVDLRLMQKPQGMVWSGLHFPSSDASEKSDTSAPWALVVDNAALNDGRLNLNVPELKLQATINAIEVQNYLSSGATPAQVSVNLAVEKLIHFPQLEKLQGKFVWQGPLQVESLDNGGWHIQTSSRLQVSDLQVHAETAAISVKRAQLPLDLDVQLPVSKELQIRLQGQPQLHEVGVASAGMTLSLARVDAPLQLQLHNGNAFTYSLQVKPQLQQLLLTEQDPDLRWLAFERAEFVLDASDQLLQVESLLINQLNVLQSAKKTPLLSNAHVRINGVRWDSHVDAPQLEINSLSLLEGRTKLTRTKSGEIKQWLPFVPGWQRITAQEASSLHVQPNKTSLAEIQAAQPAPLALHVGEINLGAGVSFAFSDYTISPAFKEEAVVKQAQLNHVRLNMADLDAPFDVQLQLKNDATLSLKGALNNSLQADGETLQSVMKVRLKNYPLSSLSGYAQAFTGYELESGELDLKSDLSLTSTLIDSQNTFMLETLSLQPRHQQQIERFAHRLTMPVEQAIDLLRDSKGRIKLKVPVVGDFSNPQVNFDHIINKAVGGAFKKASVAVISSLLQPYSAVWKAVNIVGEKATAMSLKTVIFPAGVATLDAAESVYTDKLVQVLKPRPSLVVKVCGVTNAADRQWWQQQAMSATDDANEDSDPERGQQQALNELAMERALAVKHQLIQLGVHSEQLKLCLPQHSEKSSAQSGVKLLL